MSTPASAAGGGVKRKAAPAWAPDDDVVSEYLCPITQELPVEPCIAEDGHCYDQWSLEKWMESRTEIKSPMTNQPMGRKLYPAVQVRSAIHRLIDKGVIAGEGARLWKEKQKMLDAMPKTMRVTVGRAYKGHVPSQRIFGFAYRDGLDGVEKNITSAWEWFKLAAKEDDAMAVVSIGVFYMNGTGTTKDEANGMVWLTRAAMLGSEHACVCLGNHYAMGSAVKYKNKEQAEYWYKKSVRSGVMDSVRTSRDRRDAWLKENTKPDSDSSE